MHGFEMHLTQIAGGVSVGSIVELWKSVEDVNKNANNDRVARWLFASL